VVVVVRVTMMLPGKRFAPPGGVDARGWRTDGLQMRMMAVAMVVNIVGVALVVVGLVSILWLWLDVCREDGDGGGMSEEQGFGACCMALSLSPPVMPSLMEEAFDTTAKRYSGALGFNLVG
jgi:hypothetical protein